MVGGGIPLWREGLKFHSRSRLYVMKAYVEILDVGGVGLVAVSSRSMKRGPQLVRVCPDTPRLCGWFQLSVQQVYEACPASCAGCSSYVPTLSFSFWLAEVSPDSLRLCVLALGGSGQCLARVPLPHSSSSCRNALPSRLSLRCVDLIPLGVGEGAWRLCFGTPTCWGLTCLVHGCRIPSR